MNEREFVYWLRGFIEMQNPEKLNIVQTKMIKEHLDLVFKAKVEFPKGAVDESGILKELDRLSESCPRGLLC